MRFHPLVSRVAQVMGRQLQYLQELREYAEQRQRAHREAHATLTTHHHRIRRLLHLYST